MSFAPLHLPHRVRCSVFRLVHLSLLSEEHHNTVVDKGPASIAAYFFTAGHHRQSPPSLPHLLCRRPLLILLHPFTNTTVARTTGDPRFLCPFLLRQAHVATMLAPRQQPTTPGPGHLTITMPSHRPHGHLPSCQLEPDPC